MDKRFRPERRIGLALRQSREAVGWSQETLAFESGIHRTYIGAIERGEKNVTIRNIHRIARTLGVSIAEIMQLAEL
jgi:transcriptional regulator with XRE-family HTH domain